MAPPRSACLSIFACAGAGSSGAAADPDEISVVSDKSRWSFRRRSSRNQVSRNQDVSETEKNKSINGSAEATANIQLPTNVENAVDNNTNTPTYDSEKAMEQEKPVEVVSLPTEEFNEEEKSSGVGKESSILTDENLEAALVVIQAGVRAFLAGRLVENRKILVNLQAIVRGHLVRRQAAETLQCMLAIRKMQVLVRYHQARQSLVAAERDKFLKVGRPSSIINNLTGSDDESLLNGYAQMIIRAVPASRTIHVSCNTSEFDTTWVWLERWTKLIQSSRHLLEHKDLNTMEIEQVDEETHEEKTISSYDDISSSYAVQNVCVDTPRSCESGSIEVPEYNNLGDLKAEGYKSNDPSTDLEKADWKMKLLTDNDLSTGLESEADMETNFTLFTDDRVTESREHASVSEKHDTCNTTLGDADTAASLDADGQRSMKKPCNPTFAAAKLKFEELTSSNAVICESKIRLNGTYLEESLPLKDSKMSPVEDLKNITATSDNDHEILASSAIKSSDRFETEGVEDDLENRGLENMEYENGSDDCNDGALHPEVDNTFVDAGIEEHEGEPQNEAVADDQLQEGHQQYENEINSVCAAKPVDAAIQSCFEQDSDVQIEPDSIVEPEKPVEPPVKQLLEGTPTSPTTIAEPNGTPSSDVSVNSKKSKRENRLKPHASTKRSLSNRGSDSVGRSSIEDLRKDAKNPKRETPTRAAKADSSDQEPKSSGSNSLPGYMQFTESARAKTFVCTSPKLSPDMQDIQVKKRHSLPIPNVKQGSSPRMQRYASQAQQI